MPFLICYPGLGNQISTKRGKGIDKVAKGKSATDYFKFDITVRKGDEANTPAQQIENADDILYETQHVRIDQQTLSKNSEMAPTSGQHYCWILLIRVDLCFLYLVQ